MFYSESPGWQTRPSSDLKEQAQSTVLICQLTRLVAEVARLGTIRWKSKLRQVRLPLCLLVFLTSYLYLKYIRSSKESSKRSFPQSVAGR